MPAPPTIAFCITCKGRVQHVCKTLPRNLADNAGYPHAVFVLLDYNSQDGLREYVRSAHAAEIASGRLVVYTYPNIDVFKMAHAKNLAHRLGIREGATILVNMDADNYTGSGFATYVASQFCKPNVFLWANMNQPDRPGRGCSGRIVVTKQAFLKLGGYDERFETWSPDDKDFNARLRRLGYEGLEIPRPYLNVVLHNDKMRFKEYKHVRHDQHKYHEFCAVDESTNTVVNYGKFGCGVVFRNFDGPPIELKPLPTRIFGIGMHKTSTTSLHAALEILGYESAHWKSAHWAKAIWREMNEEHKSLTLEKYYALTDLPLTILYKELDQAYPGSKFVLTIRDEQKWLRSVERHWNPAFNEFRKAWKRDAFSQIVHRELYGQCGFDRDIFLARYRRHTEEVLAHFYNRPDDLLVMNMEHAGWPELCGFLGVPQPEVPYPRVFQTEESK